MNRIKLFCFRDSVSESFGPPIGAPNIQAFVRDIVWPQLDQNSTIAKNPLDFAIYSIGDYDPSSGKIEPLQPFNHGLVSEFKKP